MVHASTRPSPCSGGHRICRRRPRRTDRVSIRDAPRIGPVKPARFGEANFWRRGRLVKQRATDQSAQHRRQPGGARSSCDSAVRGCPAPAVAPPTPQFTVRALLGGPVVRASASESGLALSGLYYDTPLPVFWRISRHKGRALVQRSPLGHVEWLDPRRPDSARRSTDAHSAAKEHRYGHASRR